MAEQEKENKGFKVVDRRVTQEKEPGSTEQEPGSPSAEQVRGPGWHMQEAPDARALPPMDFTTFCLSLASSAMIHLGQAPNPENGKSEANLPLAKQTIDILELLEEKTRGNLTAEESRLVSTLLYDLRMRYVEARGGAAKR
jgi:hypothetical protein